MSKASQSHRLPGHLVLCLGLLTSCAWAQVQSAQRNPDFSGRITRLLVLVDDPRSSDANLMQAAIHGRLEAKRIDHRVAVVPSSSDASVIDGVISAFGPQAILRIAPIATIRSPNGARQEIRYDASLFPAGEDLRRIWRAQLAHHAGAFSGRDESSMSDRMDLLAQQLVNRLVTDGVIGAN